MKISIPDQFLNGTYFYSRMMGFEFESKRSRLKVILIIGIANQNLVLLGQLMKILLTNIDFYDKLYTLFHINYFLVSLVKISTMIYNRRTILEVITEFREMCPDKKMLKSYNLQIFPKQYKLIENILVVFFWSVLCIYCFQPLLVSTIDLIKSGTFTFRYPLLVYYGIEVSGENVLHYVFMYTSQISSVYFNSIVFLTMDLCTFNLLVQLNMQLDIIRKNILSIEPDESSKAANKLTKEIRAHQKCIRIAKKLNKVFTPSVIVGLLSSSLILCFNGYQLLGEVTLAVVFKASFLLGYELKQAAIICFLGDKLIETSLHISDAAYEHKWYNGTLKYKRLVQFFLMRTQKCVALNIAGISEISLQTFQKVMSISYQIFTLLRSS